MRAIAARITLLVVYGALAEVSLVSTHQSFPLIGSDKLVVAPSEKQVALVAQYQTEIYTLNETTQIWQQHKADFGFLGTSSERWKSGGRWPLFGWTVTGQREVFVPNVSQGKGVVISGGNIEPVQTDSDIARAQFDAESPKVPGIWTLKPQEQQAFKDEVYPLLTEQAARLREIKAIRVQKELPGTIHRLLDISADGTRVLCRVTEEEPLTSLNLMTGETTDFPIHDRPRTLPGDGVASYSPDARYVLVQYLYGPDDHYAGGYLQLFTVEGEFVAELAEYSDDVGYPAGFYAWLSNAWLIYGDGKKLNFMKLTVGGP